MELKIDWADPVIKVKTVMKIQPSDLDSFYIGASDFDKSNLFFVLLASFHHYADRENRIEAAYLSFLMAYYLFITLTPPGSCELAMHYIKQAVSLNALDEYKEWIPLIEKGN